MTMPNLVEIDTLLAVVVFMGCVFAVGRGRSKYKIQAPATSGHPNFERLFRVQMNTLESLALFLPSLWIAERHADVLLVGGIGLIWVVGRIWYALAYASDPKKRGAGFGLGMVSIMALWAVAVWGIGVAMVAG